NMYPVACDRCDDTGLRFYPTDPITIAICDKQIASSVYSYTGWNTQAGVNSQAIVTAETSRPIASYSCDDTGLCFYPADATVLHIRDKEVACTVYCYRSRLIKACANS